MAVGRYGSAEAVVVNLGPVAAYLAQQQQEKKAMQQQLDRQVNDDLSKLSLDGARSQDYSAIRQGYDAFKNAAIQYKKALRDPKHRDTAEQNYLNSKAQLNAMISQSKEAKDRTKQIYDFYAKNRDQINEDEFKSGVSLLNAPIGTPQFEQSRDYDISRIAFKPEQFQADKWQTIIGSVKPQEVSMPTQLPNGQIVTEKKRMVDPRVLSTTISGLYDSDLGHGKKYWDTQFASLPPEDKQIYEEYLGKYLPGFEITNPKELAIAANMYGRVEQDLGRTITGSDRSRIESFQRQMQGEREARADARQAKSLAARAARQSDSNYYVEDDIAKNLSVGNVDNVLQPFRSEASPGTVVTYIGDRVTGSDRGAVDRIYDDLKKNGIDSRTRTISRKQLGEGAIIVAVPKINPKTKEIIKGQYEYKALPRTTKNPQPEIRALLDYARGGTAKPLPAKYYKGKLDSQPEVVIESEYAPGEFDDIDEEN